MNHVTFLALFGLLAACTAQYYSGTPPAVAEIDITVDPGDFSSLQANSIMEYPCTVKIGAETYAGARIEIHGATAREFEKKSYRITFDKSRMASFSFKYNNRGEYPYRQLILGASFIDASFMTNKLTMDTFLELGLPAPRITYARLKINGAYHGFYLVTERIGKEYVAAQGWDVNANLYKAENHSANWAPKADPLTGLDKKEGTSNPSTDIADIISAIANTARSYSAWEASVRPLFNITDLYAYNMVLNYAVGKDAFTKNYYLYNSLTDNTGMRLIAWDCDATWGTSYDGSLLSTTDDVTRLYSKDSQNEAFSNTMFSISAYKNSYFTKYYKELTSGALTTTALTAKVDFMTAVMQDYISEDTAKWSKYYFKGRLPWMQAVSRIKSIIAQRNTLLVNRLKSLCAFDRCGVCNGDGSTCNKNNIRITEVMFSQKPYFIELKNVGTTEIDLTGYEFTEGIMYRFAPGSSLAAGEHLVLVADKADFSSLFPTVTPFGTYSGNLSKKQTITLLDVNLAPVVSVGISTEAPWPQLTDSCAGRSLVSVSSSGDQNDPAQWRWSSNIAGSPGIDDPLTTTPCQNYTAPSESSMTAGTTGLGTVGMETVATTGLPFTLDPTNTATPSNSETAPAQFTIPVDTNNEEESSNSSATLVASATFALVVAMLMSL